MPAQSGPTLRRSSPHPAAGIGLQLVPRAHLGSPNPGCSATVLSPSEKSEGCPDCTYPLLVFSSPLFLLKSRPVKIRQEDDKKKLKTHSKLRRLFLVQTHRISQESPGRRNLPPTLFRTEGSYSCPSDRQTLSQEVHRLPDTLPTPASIEKSCSPEKGLQNCN